MGLFNWLFGSEKKEEENKSSLCGVKTKTDARDFLSDGEEWESPEKWYTDSDGKKVRKKKGRCCGGHCHTQSETLVDDFPMVLPFVVPNPVVPNPVVSELSTPHLYTPEHSHTPSYDSGSSSPSSSYDSGSSSSSCDSGGSCGGSCGGDY